jgi:transposase-like protein
MNTKRKPVVRQMELRELLARFSTEEACKDHLERRRWPDGVIKCPRCGSKCYRLKARPHHYLCKSGKESVDKETGVVSVCHKQNGYRFSVITRTVFENTNYPLREWFRVIFFMLHSKKGMSAHQIHRMIGTGSYETAWYMCTRIRAAMRGDMLSLSGVVEADETYIGGKDRNRHWNKKSRQQRELAGPQALGEAVGYGKTGVIGAIARKGNVVCRVIGDQDARTLAGFVRNVVDDKVTLVATDENQAYNYLDRDIRHEAVKHSAGEYVRGEVHTNNIESFWSLLKRGVVGTYHNVSKQYLPLYLNEFSFRFNNRDNPDIFDAILRGC